MSNDLTEDESLELEAVQALEELEAASAPAPPPKDKKRALLAIMNDRDRPYHVRSEAQRVLELGETHPLSYFNQRLSDFLESLEYHESKHADN